MLPSLFVRYQGLGKLYGTLFLPLLEQHGLTQIEMDILLFLANNPEYDTAKDIVEARRIAKSHVSVGVESLAARGLLQRFYADGNRKVIHLKPAPQAAEIIRQGRAVQQHYGELLMQGLLPQEKQQLFDLLERVFANAESSLTAQKGSL